MNGIVPGMTFLGVYLFGFEEINSVFSWKYFYSNESKKYFPILMKMLSLCKFSRDQKQSWKILSIFWCLLKFWHVWILASENLYLL